MSVQRVGRFLLGQALGGRVGTSHFATDAQTGDAVVVRLLSGLLTEPLTDPMSVHRGVDTFQQSFDELRRVQHPNLVPDIEAGEDMGTAYLVREFIKGVSLGQIKVENLSPADSLEIALEISRALAALHNANIVHGDMHPENILITPTEGVKLVDYGMRTIVDRVGAETGGRPNVDISPPRYGGAGPVHYFMEPSRQADLQGLGSVIGGLVGSNPEVATPRIQAMVGHLMAARPVAATLSADDVVGELAAARTRTGRARPLGPSPTPSPPEPGLATEVGEPSDEAAPDRVVNAWFTGDDDIPPLRVGTRYMFRLNIGQPRSEPAGTSRPFREPNFGHHQSLDLLVSLYSHDLEIERATHILTLPRLGDSVPITTTMTPLRAGECRLQVLVSLARELEQLQIVEISVAATSQALIPAGA